MSEQRYYKIISITTYDLIKPNENIETTPWIFPAKLSSELFTSTLNESLETLKLQEVCKKHGKSFAVKSLPPTVKKTEKKASLSKSCLGYQTLLISLCLYENREYLYTNGFLFNGKHYVRYKRSASSAKDGKCLFIQEEFFEEMMKWSSCGLDPKRQKLQTDFQAYISLTLSGIKGTLLLPAKSILLIDDVTSTFKDEVMQVSIKKEAKKDILVDASRNPEASIENTIWDGQAMLDDSVFEHITGFENKSMLLLRNRFFKTCAFRTRLQKWFTDNHIKNIDELNGYTTATNCEDIKLVITTSSLKYCKFYKDELSLEEIFFKWLNELSEQTLTFGIVKSDMKTKFMDGNMCRTSYQFMATLGLSREETHQLLQPSIEYLEKIKSDEASFRHYTKMQTNRINNDLPHDTIYLYDVCNYMTAITNSFASTSMYRDFYYRETKRFRDDIKNGEILVDGTFATLFGNPIEFLYATTHKDYNPDSTTRLYINNESLISALNGNQVYTSLFEPGTELCCYRSPHTTMGNILLVKVAYNQFIEDYFCLSNTILCVNSIGQNIMHRLNGADYDSDFVLMTDNPIIVNNVSKYYSLFPVPYYQPQTRRKHKASAKIDYNSPKRLAKIDNTICNNLIGYISNLAFILNNMLWDRLGKNISTVPVSKINIARKRIYLKKGEHLSAEESKIFSTISNAEFTTICELEGYYQTLATLAVLCGLEIDKAKRTYDFSMSKLFRTIKTEMVALMLSFPRIPVSSNDTLHKSTDSSSEITIEKLPEFVESILDQTSEQIFSIFEDPTLDITSRTEWECTLSYLYSYKFKETHYPKGKAIPLIEIIPKPSKNDANLSRQKNEILTLFDGAKAELNKYYSRKMYLFFVDSEEENSSTQRQRIINNFFEGVSTVKASAHVIYSLLKGCKGQHYALLFAGLLFSKKSELLIMLLKSYKEEETFELVPAEEDDTDTVSLFGHPHRNQRIIKEELPFIKSLLEEN